MATPVVGSTSRKLAQPLVRQYGRFDCMVRRRMRRMELARPARDAVVVREITVVLCFPFFAHGSGLGGLRGLRCARYGRNVGRSGGIRCWRTGALVERRSTVSPRFGLTQESWTSNGRSVKRGRPGWCSVGTPGVQSDGLAGQLERSTFRIMARAVNRIARRSR